MTSRPKRILALVGTRPEVVKMAPVVRALRALPGECEALVCTTGQHESLARQAMASMGLEADIALESMSAGQPLGRLVGRLFQEIDRVIERVSPDWVLVQGDTVSAMAGATCAFYRRARVGHVEAGLRTHDRNSPFPEEVNRVAIARVADLHFAPTARAAANLAAEGVAGETVHVTGNTIVDALEWIRPQAADRAEDGMRQLVARLGAARIVLATLHRRESFGAGVEEVCRAVAAIAERHADAAVVFVNHLNPEVREPVRRALEGRSRVTLVDPVDYFSLLFLMARATLVLTDSGGIQEEAPSFGKPVLVLREVTERPEAVEAGCARVVGTRAAAIVEAACELLDDRAAYESMVAKRNPFGDGRAGARIAQLVVRGAESAAP